MNTLSQACHRSVAALRLLRSSLQGRPAFFIRSFATDGNGKDENGDNSDDKPPKQQEEEIDEDEFGMEGFELDEDIDDEELSQVLEKVADGQEVSEELASDLVERMVKAATTRLAERNDSRTNILSALTPHTLFVLRASRITTNRVIEAGSYYTPHILDNKVTAELHIDQLELSRPAQAALEYLAGPRLREGYVKISCNKYPSMQENRARIVTQMDKLVAAAKEAVGENVDQTPLETWDAVRNEVEIQAKEDIEEAGDLGYVIGEAKN